MVSGEALAEVSRAQNPPETVHRMLGACVYLSDKKAPSLGQILQSVRSKRCWEPVVQMTVRSGLGESPRREVKEGSDG